MDKVTPYLSLQSIFPNFTPEKAEVLSKHPSLIFILLLLVVFLVAVYFAFKKVRKGRRFKKVAYVEGQILQLSFTDHGQIIAHPVGIDDEKVVTKLKDGMLVLLRVPEHFQIKYQTTDEVRARYINPRHSKLSNGEELIESWGFVFPDYYKIGSLTFEQILDEPEFSVTDFLQKEVLAAGQEICRLEPDRKVLTTT